MSDRSNENTPSHAVMRGVIIGGSIGMIASWFGYEPVQGLLHGHRLRYFRRRHQDNGDRMRKK